MIKVLMLSIIGGYIFSKLHIPIPWMLGPIVVLIITQFIHKGELKWPRQLGDLGVVIVGTGIGLRFNIHLFESAGFILLYMFLLNVILIGGAVGIAYLISRFSKMPLRASVLGAIPGGLSQTVLFAERENIGEVGSIFYFQVIRLLLVVMIVPFIVAGQAAGQTGDAKFSVSLVFIIAMTWAFSVFMDRIHFPVAQFIAPIILLIALQLATPLTMPQIPGLVMVIAQLFIGAQIGLKLTPEKVQLPVRVLIGGVMSALALIALTLGSSFIMSFLMDTKFTTSFLSTAPGGIDQMVLLADAVNADISIVSLFQTSRLLFIFIIVMPLLKAIFRWREKKERIYEQKTNVEKVNV